MYAAKQEGTDAGCILWGRVVGGNVERGEHVRPFRCVRGGTDEGKSTHIPTHNFLHIHTYTLLSHAYLTHSHLNEEVKRTTTYINLTPL